MVMARFLSFPNEISLDIEPLFTAITPVVTKSFADPKEKNSCERSELLR
jgi:hypothetical protein